MCSAAGDGLREFLNKGPESWKPDPSEHLKKLLRRVDPDLRTVVSLHRESTLFLPQDNEFLVVWGRWQQTQTSDKFWREIGWIREKYSQEAAFMWLNLSYIEWLLDNPHMAVGDLPPGAVVPSQQPPVPATQAPQKPSQQALPATLPTLPAQEAAPGSSTETQTLPTQQPAQQTQLTEQTLQAVPVTLPT